MNREEAKKEYDISLSNPYDFETFIDKIYDDVETRFCINCKFGEPFADKRYSMVNCEISEENYPYKYGCISFERKEDE